jgi:predicted short-subunit dehydrogenase-like oxidoreductase (DUF2520 family)
VIARWLFEAGQVRIGRVANRSLDSAREAVGFIGAGRAVEACDEAPESGWLLLGLPDRGLLVPDATTRAWLDRRPELVFHLSGALGARVLAPFGVAAASLHPVRAFASPAAALSAMPGTPCVVEGEPAVLERLRRVIVGAGGEWLELGQADKARYHAATVVASNGLVALTQLARALAESAGLESDQARGLLDHLQRGTLDNLRSTPAERALTGPVERADPIACERLLQAVDASREDRADLFRAIGRATLELAVSARGTRSEDEGLARLFDAEATSHSD